MKYSESIVVVRIRNTTYTDDSGKVIAEIILLFKKYCYSFVFTILHVLA